jgi:hypothetical protein
VRGRERIGDAAARRRRAAGGQRLGDCALEAAQHQASSRMRRADRPSVAG